jgi:hydroxymethylglutaryl-CoA reductase
MIKFIFYKSLFILQAQKLLRMQINGFSKLSKKDKINWLLKNYFTENENVRNILEKYWNSDASLQQLHDEFVENTLTNYYLPYAVAPNFKIDDKIYAVPMVIEESSVVAAASKAAKFWMDKGGFKTEILGTDKIGHVHFTYKGETREIINFFRKNRSALLDNLSELESGMKKRGGGIKDVNLIDKTHRMSGYYQLEFKFDTVDAMGANFINTILESAADFWKQKAAEELTAGLDIIMSILSNYTPGCLVKAEVSCDINQLGNNTITGADYAEKFIKAVEIAQIEPYRAVTHNKGIMNGIDALVLATGNDFRAVEANAHAFAARSGQYKSLSKAQIDNGKFRFWIEIPIAVGTIGGLTAIHPLVKFSLQLLQNPDARQLMKIMASLGLAQNFSAINSLITSGIQKGHMKMHLNNLLLLLQATPEEQQKAKVYFSDKKVSLSALKSFLNRK